MENNRQENGMSKLVQTIIVTLGAMGLLGGGGGAYLVNDSVNSLQNDFRTTLAVVENNMNHMAHNIEELSKKIKDLGEGFKEEFKHHINDPSIHSIGITRAKDDILKDCKHERDKLEQRIVQPQLKQWQLINDLKDKIAGLESKLSSLEAKSN